ncbi:MAG: DUF1549 domain-containing protein [Planctomycetota bacterium]
MRKTLQLSTVLFLMTTALAASEVELNDSAPPASSDPAIEHPIDRWLAPYFETNGVKPGSIVDDFTFARRVSLDLTGLIPTREDLETYLADPPEKRRTLLIDRLLKRKKAFADHWLSFWNDALRNAYRGTGFIDGGRKQITEWLYASLYENKPYDRFVHELISPVSGSEGFTKGLIWRGVVNASQVPEMQAAQNVSQVFLGINLKCASCHDSFVNDWKLKDAYALASVFADKPLAIHRCNEPTGETSSVGFLFPSLGKIDANASRQERMKRLAELVTSPRNGRFLRTIVNRLWAWFFGRGIVATPDDLDGGKPWHPELLDWLAADLAANGFDLQHTMRRICTSRAYQLASVGALPPEETSYTFRGPTVKRMTAEQFVDALSAVSGVPLSNDPGGQKRDGRGQGGQQAAVRRATFNSSSASKSPGKASPQGQWIWSHKGAAKSDPGGSIFLRKTFELSFRPDRANAILTCDDHFILWVNGHRVLENEDWRTATSIDLSPQLVRGKNVIAVHASNWPDKRTKKGLDIQNANPAGFFFSTLIEAETRRKKHSVRISSDGSWTWSPEPHGKWKRYAAPKGDWKPASVIASFDAGPWNLGDSLRPHRGAIHSASGLVRAALVKSDPLTRALGRPTREQVVTTRDSLATTLQCLELTNGDTLARWLENGSKTWTSRELKWSDLVTQVYETALSRPPNPREVESFQALATNPVEKTAVEDLLWIVLMLPEFQLIR